MIRFAQTADHDNVADRSLQLTSGEDPVHDEIGKEFIVNKSSDPKVLNTNVWANDDDKKEQ